MTETLESSDGRPLPPKPNPAPAPPPGAKATTLALMLGPKPIDTNGNGYPDVVQVEVYLFAEPHPTPVVEAGEFVFTLYPPRQAADPHAAPVASWRIAGDEMAKAFAVSRVGPCWRFSLPIAIDVETHLPSTGDLVAIFEPADGRAPVKASGVRTIQFSSTAMKPPESVPAAVACADASLRFVPTPW